MPEEVAIRRAFAEFLPHPPGKLNITRCFGGDIHRSYRVDAKNVDAGRGSWFVKVCDLARKAVLESEFESLAMLARLQVANYPQPIEFKIDHQYCYLIMSWHELLADDCGVNDTNSFAAMLGRALAKQHRIGGKQFGWHADNYIGLTLQANQCGNDWIEFYRSQRLSPQLALAGRNGIDADLFIAIECVLESLSLYFENYCPEPCLLHGDLWAGNAAFDGRRKIPLLYDPAPYFGDREADIAMTELFGGFSKDFYTSYQQQWPLHAGYAKRRPLYNLYHALNHFNLFGPSYQSLVRSNLMSLGFV